MNHDIRRGKITAPYKYRTALRTKLEQAHGVRRTDVKRTEHPNQNDAMTTTTNQRRINSHHGGGWTHEKQVPNTSPFVHKRLFRVHSVVA